VYGAQHSAVEDPTATTFTRSYQAGSSLMCRYLHVDRRMSHIKRWRHPREHDVYAFDTSLDLALRSLQMQSAKIWLLRHTTTEVQTAS